MKAVEENFRQLLQKVLCLWHEQIFVYIDEDFAINGIRPKFLCLLCLGYICLTTSIRCPYDVKITVSVRPPQGDLAIIVRIYGHRGLYDFV